MPTIDVIDLNRRKVGAIELRPDVFGAEANMPVLHEVVLQQQAGLRQGTASTKTRGLVSGSGKKPYKQKHTGRARAGSIRSPLWRHGGIAFGPLPRDYGYTMPKKKTRGAVRSALSVKVRVGGLAFFGRFSATRRQNQINRIDAEGSRPCRQDVDRSRRRSGSASPCCEK